jgi:hypothetical protein
MGRSSGVAGVQELQNLRGLHFQGANESRRDGAIVAFNVSGEAPPTTAQAELRPTGPRINAPCWQSARPLPDVLASMAPCRGE